MLSPASCPRARASCLYACTLGLGWHRTRCWLYGHPWPGTSAGNMWREHAYAWGNIYPQYTPRREHIPRDMCSGKHISRGNTYHSNTGMDRVVCRVVQIFNKRLHCHISMRLRTRPGSFLMQWESLALLPVSSSMLSCLLQLSSFLLHSNQLVYYSAGL